MEINQNILNSSFILMSSIIFESLFVFSTLIYNLYPEDDNRLLFFGPTFGILLPVVVNPKLAAKDAVCKIFAEVNVFD